MAIIRVSGYPGAGKTTICKLLTEALGYEYFYTGAAFRDMAKTRNQSIEDFYRDLSSDPELERKIDDVNEKRMMTRDNLIVEGRVAPFQKSGFKTINILLKVSPKEGVRRQSLRPENKGRAIEEIEKLTVERIKNEREHYKRIHGIADHFDESKFDIVLDTTNLSVDEAFDMILKQVTQLTV
ncbi:MAG: AAA family ATPase [Patescibacteria group bacterium]